MTHDTDAERAEFEKNYRDRNEGSRLYCESEWRGWQAARRAPAAPVPKKGWRYVPEVLTPEMKLEFMDMLMDGIDIYMNSNDQIEIQTDAPRRIWKSLLAAAPQPPEAAPVQLPEPSAWMLGCQTMGGDVGWKLSWSKSGAGVCHRLSGEEFEHPLYTEKQVRELLASAKVERKPISDSVLDDEYLRDQKIKGEVQAFRAGARFAEAFHGIGKDKA